jgi:hypothetical protein
LTPGCGSPDPMVDAMIGVFVAIYGALTLYVVFWRR